jgi:hypothetical protein
MEFEEKTTSKNFILHLNERKAALCTLNCNFTCTQTLIPYLRNK